MVWALATQNPLSNNDFLASNEKKLFDNFVAKPIYSLGNYV